MINTILYIVFFGFFFLIWQRMRTTATKNKTWLALLSTYKTEETPQSLSGTYLEIINLYFDEDLMERIYKFYNTPKGLLITLRRDFFIKQSVLIPWNAIEPTKLNNNRMLATMQCLKVANAEAAKIEITRGDYIQHIRNHLDA